MGYDTNVTREYLVRVLQFLAGDYEEQVGEFPESRDVPELLTLLWHDSFEENREVFESGLVSTTELDRLREIDGVFGKICAPGRTEVWSNTALKQTAEWNELRAIARDLLLSLNPPAPARAPPPPEAAQKP